MIISLIYLMVTFIYTIFSHIFVDQQSYMKYSADLSISIYTYLYSNDIVIVIMIINNVI